MLSTCYNITMNSMILRAFGFGKPDQWVPTAVLLSLAVAQLLLLMLLPAFYRRNRTKVALFNCILRLLLLTAAAVFAKPGLMDTMAMSKQHRSAANGSQHNSWLVFMRKVLGPPLVYMGHANHVLPFQWTLLMQLYMVAVCSVAVFRSSTCVLATSDSNAAMAARVCAYAKHVVFYVSRAVGRLPYDTSLDAADACKGLAAILLLLLYTHVVLLLIVPGVVMFRIELSLKSEFVRLRGGCVPKVWQMLDSADAMLLLAYTLVVGAWCVCEAAVAWLRPVACSNTFELMLSSSSSNNQIKFELMLS
jgi:hypothetical protein